MNKFNLVLLGITYFSTLFQAVILFNESDPMGFLYLFLAVGLIFLARFLFSQNFKIHMMKPIQFTQKKYNRILCYIKIK